MNIVFAERKRSGYKGCYASVVGGNQLRLSASCRRDTPIDNYDYARVGKDEKNDNILYILLAYNKKDGYVDVRDEHSQSGTLISCGPLLRSLSYRPEGEGYDVHVSSYEGEPMLILKRKY